MGVAGGTKLYPSPRTPMKINQEVFKMAKEKFYTFTVMLYEDNKYHMQMLEYFKICNLQGCYIWHKAEEGELKDHYHVIISFDNKRSLRGFCESFGKYPCWVHYNEENKADMVYWEDTPDCVEEVRYVVNEAIASPVRDLNAYCEYILHKDFESRVIGKKLYSETDVHDFGTNFFEKHHKVYERTEDEIIARLSAYASVGYDTPYKLNQILLDNNDFNAIAFIRKNSNYVDKFILGKRNDIRDDVFINNSSKNGNEVQL